MFPTGSPRAHDLLVGRWCLHILRPLCRLTENRSWGCDRLPPCFFLLEHSGQRLGCEVLHRLSNDPLPYLHAKVLGAPHFWLYAVVRIWLLFMSRVVSRTLDSIKICRAHRSWFPVSTIVVSATHNTQACSIQLSKLARWTVQSACNPSHHCLPV